MKKIMETLNNTGIKLC